MISLFGPEFNFLTIAFDDANSPQVFHLIFSQPDNINFPSTADKKYYLLRKKVHPTQWEM